MKWKRLLISSSILAMGLMAGSTTAHADDDPRFDGDIGGSMLGQTYTAPFRYDFDHGGNNYREWDPSIQDYVPVGGYWSGSISGSFQYKVISPSQIEILPEGFNAKSWRNTVSNHGGGFWDLAGIARNGGSSFDGGYASGANEIDQSSDIWNRAANDPDFFFFIFHYNKGFASGSTAWTWEDDNNDIFRQQSNQQQSGIRSSYLVNIDADNRARPFSGIDRYRNTDTSRAFWAVTPLNSVSIYLPPDKVLPKIMNNTTSATSDHSGSIAPDGPYDMNERYDGIRKILSWPTGENNGKWFTTGDKVTLRNMSPVLQADNGQSGTGRFNALKHFLPGQVFKQSVHVDSRLSYNGGAKMWAITRSGTRVDASDKFNFYWDGDRLVAQAKDMYDESYGGYNNAQTVGYSMTVPTTVQGSGDSTINVRGGNQIFDGNWHDTGNDVIHIYDVAKPEASETTSRAAVYNFESSNNADKSFLENSVFYDNGNADNKTFRAWEQDGYVVNHDVKAAPQVSDDIRNNLSVDVKQAATWTTSQDMTIVIPYDDQSVIPVGGLVTRLSPDYQRMLVGTNGIRGEFGSRDGRPAYIVTIPASMINAYIRQGTKWEVAMKYQVRQGLPTGGKRIDSTATSTDEISGVKQSNNVVNYVTDMKIAYNFETLDGDHSLASFTSGQNKQVHLVNGQVAAATYSLSGFGKGNASTGVGQPLKEGRFETTIPANAKFEEMDLLQGDQVVYRARQLGNNVGNMWIETNIENPDQFFLAQLSGQNDYDHEKTVKLILDWRSLMDKHFLYDRDDWKIVVKSSTRPTSEQSNITNSFDGVGSFWTARTHSYVASASLADHWDGANHPGIRYESSDTVTQPVSRKHPSSYLAKHDVWSFGNQTDVDRMKLDNTSIQAREVFDYRLEQFLGNSTTNTEAYGTGMDLVADIGDKNTVSGDIKVMGYTIFGELKDFTSQFNIHQEGNVVTASKKMDQDEITHQYGSHYNALYVLSIPLKNQGDKLDTVKSSIAGKTNVNGQTVDADYQAEYIPPETPYFYGYSATSADNRFDPRDPEKDKGKIAYQNSEQASTSAQISTAPIQWVLREQLGDMSGQSTGQKYAYEKFTAEFPDAAIFKRYDQKSFKVYDETGRDVSGDFEGQLVGSQGFKVSAKKSFLENMSNYGHKYYFVVDATVQNSHNNRLQMAVKTATGTVYNSFKHVLSAMSSLAGKIGIGNTDKSTPIQNLHLQNEMNLLQINTTRSNLNEKVSQLNDRSFDSGDYQIQNVGLDRPTAGYNVVGATAQFATNARRYDSYRTTFSASGGVDRQRVRANSIRIIDSLTGQDVTGQYDIDVQEQSVSINAKSEAIDRMTAEHRNNLNDGVQDSISFHVDTWGSRDSDSTVTWLANHNINGYDDARSTERVTIPQSHGGHMELSVAPAGSNNWQSSDLKLKETTNLVDVRLKVTVPDDLHNADFTDFIARYIGSEIVPYTDQQPITATIKLGDNSDYRQGTTMQMTTVAPGSHGLNDSRILWQIPDTIATVLNNSDAVTKSPTYTVILHNVSYFPNVVRTNDQYLNYLQKSNQVEVPTGMFTTGASGQKDSLSDHLVEGKNGALVDKTFGEFGSGTNLGLNSGNIRIILPEADSVESGYINGRESNTSYTNKNA